MFQVMSIVTINVWAIKFAQILQNKKKNGQNEMKLLENERNFKFKLFILLSMNSNN